MSIIWVKHLYLSDTKYVNTQFSSIPLWNKHYPMFIRVMSSLPEISYALIMRSDITIITEQWNIPIEWIKGQRKILTGNWNKELFIFLFFTKFLICYIQKKKYNIVEKFLPVLLLGHVTFWIVDPINSIIRAVMLVQISTRVSTDILLHDSVDLIIEDKLQLLNWPKFTF